ncbi:MAG: NAD-dependent epimerase/dehydratase family protein, partial [Deltaproteobacteria bacterium]
MSESPLVLLGCGFVGRVVALRAIRAGRMVVATVRSTERARQLANDGVDARILAALTPDVVRTLASPGFDLLVAFPPDGVTDAVLAAAPLGAARSVYLSSTGVYGNHRGDVDEETPAVPDSPRTWMRLEAESAWRAGGAVSLRAAAIYGPGRGLPRRIAERAFQIPGTGGNVVSQIHVEDLADLVMAALERAAPGSVYLAADDAPGP